MAISARLPNLDFDPGSKWVVLNDYTGAAVKVGDILELDQCWFEQAYVHNHYYTLSFHHGHVHGFLPNDDNFMMVMPMSLFTNRELFLLRMTGKIEIADYDMRLANLNAVFESHFEMAFPNLDPSVVYNRNSELPPENNELK